MNPVSGNFYIAVKMHRSYSPSSKTPSKINIFILPVQQYRKRYWSMLRNQSRLVHFSARATVSQTVQVNAQKPKPFSTFISA